MWRKAAVFIQLGTLFLNESVMIDIFFPLRIHSKTCGNRSPLLELV
jgi:hypothetical protein